MYNCFKSDLDGFIISVCLSSELMVSFCSLASTTFCILGDSVQKTKVFPVRRP